MLKLYYAPGSCARASHIALREANAEFELQLVDFATAEQRGDEYLSINPKGRVPALATENGILTETPALLAYIAQRFPEANLAPLSDPFEFARLQSFNAYMCATVHVAHAHIRRGERWADDAAAIAEMKRKAPEVVAACFQMIEDEFFTVPGPELRTYQRAHQATSNRPAAPIPPPTHMVITTYLTPRRLPSISAWPIMREPLIP